MIRTLQRLKLLFLFCLLIFFGQLKAQECEDFGLVSNGFFLGAFNCEIVIIGSDGGELFQPVALTEELSPGNFIRFSYEVLDSTDCTDDIPLINITCIESFFDTEDSTGSNCNFAIESTVLIDSSGMSVYRAEVFNQTDFGPYRPQQVRWYEYETGIGIGEEAVIEYMPGSSSAVINICAEIFVELSDGSICESTICHTLVQESLIPLEEECQAFFVYTPSDQGVDKGQVTFYNLSFGAYSGIVWDFGDGTIDTSQAEVLVHTYETPGLYEVCLMLEGSSGLCAEFCLPVFTVSGTDICNFSDCVFPGDTNKDGAVNIFDVLNIGLGFNSTGQPRPNAGIDPIFQAAFDWAITSLFDLNFKHVDCDGNGVIDAADFTAIDQNYQQYTGSRTFSSDPALPQVRLAFPSDTILINPDQPELKVPVSLMIGTEELPLRNFYGIALSLDYEPTTFSSVQTDYEAGSSFGSEDLILTRQKNLSADGQLGLAITRTDQTGVDGSGKIAELGFIVIADLIEGRVTTQIDIRDLVVVDSNGVKIPVSVDDSHPGVTILFEDQVVDVKEPLSASLFNVYPNPATASLVLDLGVSIDLSQSSVEIFNVLGQEVHRQLLKKHQTTMAIDHLDAGIYLVRINTDKGQGLRKVLVE